MNTSTNIVDMSSLQLVADVASWLDEAHDTPELTALKCETLAILDILSRKTGTVRGVYFIDHAHRRVIISNLPIPARRDRCTRGLQYSRIYDDRRIVSTRNFDAASSGDGVFSVDCAASDFDQDSITPLSVSRAVMDRCVALATQIDAMCNGDVWMFSV